MQRYKKKAVWQWHMRYTTSFINTSVGYLIFFKKYVDLNHFFLISRLRSISFTSLAKALLVLMVSSISAML